MAAVTAMADHLWQSTWCALAIWIWLRLWRGGFASVRHGLLLLASLKFLLPLSALYALGMHVGYPVRYPNDLPPPSIVAAVDATWPMLWPASYLPVPELRSSIPWLLGATWIGGALFFGARWLHSARAMRGIALDATLPASEPASAFARQYARRRYHAKEQLQRLTETLFWFHPLVWWIGRALPAEAARACALPQDDPSQQPLGFVRGAVVAACAWFIPMQALVSGAVHDRQHRYAVLMADSESLRTARIELTEAAPGMGERMRITTSADGVLIRNANLRELVAISFGVTRFDVIANQMKSSLTTADDEPHWMYWPRYDLRVTGKLNEPGMFDSYALHQRVTELLVERFGFEINVNGECQRPCGRWEPAPQGSSQLANQE
jgi:hypothetical protein